MKKKKQLKKQMENKTVLIWKMGIASALSWEIAKLAGSDHPYLAPLSVILCLQTTINRSIRFSYHRMVGTVIGIVVVVLMEPYLKVTGWTVGGLIILGSFITKWLKRDETAIHQVALTVLLVFVMGHKSGNYPIDRFRDTLIGAIIAVLIQMVIHPPNYTKHAVKSSIEYSSHLTKSFKSVADWLEKGIEKANGEQIQTELKKRKDELYLLKDIISDVKDSLKYNPFARNSKKDLHECEQRLQVLSEGYSYLHTTVKTLMAWAEAGTITSLDEISWADQIKVLAQFFQTIETTVGSGASANILKITIPEVIKKHQYSLSIYNETILLLKKWDQSPSIRLRD